MPGRLHVIPPGAGLAVRERGLRLSAPGPRHGARRPFDFLLNSLAADVGPRAACVALSGAGADGSVGLRAIGAGGGLVIAEEPAEAARPDMPEAAVATGLVDRIPPIAQIARFVAARSTRPERGDGAAFEAILALVRARAAQDVTLYGTGAVTRRIERRMAPARLAPDAYPARLREDDAEPGRLVSDLPIHATSFFRDPAVFARLAETATPELPAALPAERAPRIWVAGCSTGEEACSLAMSCSEAMEAAGSTARLQALASDVAPDAAATAREGAPCELDRRGRAGGTAGAPFRSRGGRPARERDLARLRGVRRAGSSLGPAAQPDRPRLPPQRADRSGAGGAAPAARHQRTASRRRGGRSPPCRSRVTDPAAAA